MIETRRPLRSRLQDMRDISRILDENPIIKAPQAGNRIAGASLICSKRFRSRSGFILLVPEFALELGLNLLDARQR
jgi:hypothetical protein